MTSRFKCWVSQQQSSVGTESRDSGTLQLSWNPGSALHGLCDLEQDTWMLWTLAPPENQRGGIFLTRLLWGAKELIHARHSHDSVWHMVNAYVTTRHSQCQGAGVGELCGGSLWPWTKAQGQHHYMDIKTAVSQDGNEGEKPRKTDLDVKCGSDFEKICFINYIRGKLTLHLNFKWDFKCVWTTLIRQILQRDTASSCLVLEYLYNEEYTIGVQKMHVFICIFMLAKTCL